MGITPLNVLNKLLGEVPGIDRGVLIWTDFRHPSSLKLKGFVDKLLFSVETKDGNYESVKLGIHEALVNAVKHGNAYEENKYLRVRRIITPKWFIWQIQDQGNGIPIELRRGSLPDQIDSDNGRGMFIIYNCFDDIRWSLKGNRIQLAKKRD